MLKTQDKKSGIKIPSCKSTKLASSHTARTKMSNVKKYLRLLEKDVLLSNDNQISKK